MRKVEQKWLDIINREIREWQGEPYVHPWLIDYDGEYDVEVGE